MTELLVPSSFISDIRAEIFSNGNEGCAILFTREYSTESGKTRLLVKEYKLPTQFDYHTRKVFEATLTPLFVAEVTKYAIKKGYGLVFCHSHPGQEHPEFSKKDDYGESLLKEFLERRAPTKQHCALVFGESSVNARLIGSKSGVRVIELGKKRNVLFDPSDDGGPSLDLYDRQIRAFGQYGQQKISKIKVAIVGLGGTGSIIAQQLAHLGVTEFTLIDPDVVEVTNLNRLANAHLRDVGKYKTEIAENYIKNVVPYSRVEVINGDIIKESVAKRLCSADFVFICTDSHGSRAIIQQIAYQYFIPCIDVGTVIAVNKGNITHVQGRIQYLSVGEACLNCTGLLDPNLVRQDLMTAFEKKSDPYIVGETEPAPAVMSINGTVSSMAVSMFLNVLTELPLTSRNIMYDYLNTRLRNVEVTPQDNCYICSSKGFLGEANSEPLLARKD